MPCSWHSVEQVDLAPEGVDPGVPLLRGLLEGLMGLLVEDALQVLGACLCGKARTSSNWATVPSLCARAV
jgi:hypothetical protein